LALHVMRREHVAKASGGRCGSVATKVLKISPDFLSKENKNLGKQTKFKPPNT